MLHAIPAGEDGEGRVRITEPAKLVTANLKVHHITPWIEVGCKTAAELLSSGAHRRGNCN